MRKSTHVFPFLSYMTTGLCLAALWAAGALLQATNLEVTCVKQLYITLYKGDGGISNIRYMYGESLVFSKERKKMFLLKLFDCKLCIFMRETILYPIHVITHASKIWHKKEHCVCSMHKAGIKLIML